MLPIFACMSKTAGITQAPLTAQLVFPDSKGQKEKCSLI